MCTNFVQKAHLFIGLVDFVVYLNEKSLGPEETPDHAAVHIFFALHGKTDLGCSVGHISHRFCLWSVSILSA